MSLLPRANRMSLPEATGCHAIVLAAGTGSRFGGGKLLAPFRGRPLIYWSVAAALSSRVTSVTAVLGARADDVAAALAPFADRRLSLVRCRQWKEGLSASLTYGLRTLPQDTRAVAIFLGDMPDLDPGLADRVLTEVVGGAPAAYPECKGLPGHPVALSSKLFPLIESLKGDQGARAVLAGQSGVIRVPTDDPGSIADIDTRHDLKRLEP